MDTKKINRGDRLQPALLELEKGQSLRVPFKFFSENTLRATAAQVKASTGMVFEVNARANTHAVITRTE